MRFFKLFVFSYFMQLLFLQCSSMNAQKMEIKHSLLFYDAQGGRTTQAFEEIKTSADFSKALLGENPNVVQKPGYTDPNLPKFPENKKVIQYFLGDFYSGNHAITKINAIYLHQDTLLIEVPKKIEQEFEIQILSSPRFIFAIPTDINFKTIKIIYSK